MLHHGSNKERCVNWFMSCDILCLNLQLNCSGGNYSFKGVAGIQTVPTALFVYLPGIDRGTFEPPLDTERGCLVARTLEPIGRVVYTALSTVWCGLGLHLFHSEKWGLKLNSADVCCPWLLRRGSRVFRDAPFSLPGFPQLIE